MKKLAFVTPWYGKDIPGGAEMELRELVYHLRDAEVELEVLSTCVQEFMSDWNENYHKPGITIEDGITVRRFKVKKGNHNRFHQINKKLMSGESITPGEEQNFISDIVNSTDLYEYMYINKDEYSMFVFIPYMFGTTYFGMAVCPEKSVMIPCLHDESYAYMKIFLDRFSSVRGMIFNSRPECELAKRLYNLSSKNLAVIGAGLNTDLDGNAERFRKKFNIKKPFILYVGRKDATKNVDTLIDYFTRYKNNTENDNQLVLIGPGSLPIPESVKNDVHDLGFLAQQDKYDALTAAVALCQPSKNESFSLVMMESWLALRPVIVHGACDVTADFAQESKGGLSFLNYSEFEARLSYLFENHEDANNIGRNGRDYVINMFSWNTIVEKYLDFFKRINDDIEQDTLIEIQEVSSPSQNDSIEIKMKSKIFQVIVTMMPGDAMGNDCLLLDKKFKSIGLNSRIYSIYNHYKSKENIYSYDSLPELNRDDVVIYHMCEKTKINADLKKMDCKKIAVYHNVTPAHFFTSYLPGECKKQAESVIEIQSLSSCFDWCIAVSEFNKQDLVRLGYDANKITVIPINIEFEDYKQFPDKAVIEKYRDGYVNILFVGRIVPNKKQEDIIRAFAYYKKHINAKSRLILIGSPIGEKYITSLKQYVSSLDLPDVIFTGKTSFQEILAFYRIANIFLCLSEHEGFCVPLVEAMMFDVPIIAYNSSAIEYTLNGCGVLIDEKNPALLSKVIERIVKDNDTRKKIIAGQQKRLKDFEGNKTFSQVLDVVNQVAET